MCIKSPINICSEKVFFDARTAAAIWHMRGEEVNNDDR